MKDRNYWVISPNVKNEKEEVDDWRKFLSKYPLVCMGWSPNDKGGDYFYNKMNIDDVVIVAQRQSWNWNIYSLGMVGSNVFYDGDGLDSNVWDEMPSESRYRKLSYWISKPKIDTFKGYKGQIPPAIWKLTDEETIKSINMMITNEKRNIELNERINLLKSNKNIILTGAPGTGKTYLAKQIAKQMIGVETDEELEKSGQFAFVQFHPSYDYTDFVEGLRPTPPDENGIIGFEIKDGIFKSFCDKALRNLIDSEKTPDEIKRESNIESILDNFLADSIENGKKFDYNNNSNQFVIVPHSKKDECFYAKILNNESMERQLVFKKDTIEVFKKADEIKKPTDIQKLFNTRFKYQYTFIFLILEQLREKLNHKVEEPKTEIKRKNFIFVIDEINRGEISKIFGELFFSIDPSYRGKKGAVKTQYSNLHNDENEVFYVPENVYIIGSMNDIDRSVESFDFAMRRRFTWIEITAEQSADNMSLPEEIKERMLKLNEQISKTDGLNPSYHIGAAYFLDSNGNARQDIDNIWKLRIEPLLKEYLRGIPDCFEKIELLKNSFLD